MSVVPICCKIQHRDQTPQIRRSIKRWDFDENRRKSFSGVDSMKPRTFCCASDSSTNNDNKQLKSLSSYLGKLKDSKKTLNSLEPYSKERLDQVGSNRGLETLETYLSKVDKDANSDQDHVLLVEPRPSKPFYSNEDFEPKDGRKPSNYTNRQDEEASDVYLTGVLASINIAVILFELASPVKTSELEISTIPFLYGAKVNQLIMVGEWWRLVTPMFLHSGIFHIGLSCWSLLTFGPKVCRGYGWFTFLLIYILGGFSGNFISFLHTPDPTVGGTGPVYAIIGAWLIYQLQNKDVIPKDVSEALFQKAMIATGLGLILSHFCPIDEWAHFGAIFTGVGYGFLLSPTLEVDEQDEGIALVKRHSDPWKSLLYFGVFVLVLSSLFLFFEPPLNDLVSESFFLNLS